MARFALTSIAVKPFHASDAAETILGVESVGALQAFFETAAMSTSEGALEAVLSLKEVARRTLFDARRVLKH